MSDFSFYIAEDDGTHRLVSKYDFALAVSKLLEDLHNLDDWGDEDPAVLLQFATTAAYAREVFRSTSAQYLEYIKIEPDNAVRHRMWINLMHTTANLRAINPDYLDELPLPDDPA